MRSRRGAAALAVGAVTVLVALPLAFTLDDDDVDDGAEPQVLGVQITRPPTTTTTHAGLLPPDERATAAEDPASTTTATTAPPPVSGQAVQVVPATPAAPATTAAPRPPVRTVERSDNSGFFVHEPGGDGPAGSSTRIEPGDPDPFRFHLTIAPPQSDDGAARIHGTMQNRSGRPIGFPGGLRIQISLSRDGGPPRLIDLHLADVVDLAPGETLTITGDLFVAEHGHYDYFATAEVEYR